MMTRFLVKFFPAATLMTLVGGCASTITGEDGNLKFTYFSAFNSNDRSDFNKPIAIGAKLDIQVEAAGSKEGDDAIVERVESSDEAIIKSALAGGDTITLEAVSEGSAEISVDAAVARTGETESDRFTMRTATPEVIELTHLCDTGATKATYLVGRKEVFLGYEMKLKDGQRVIGYGYYPVSATPAEGVSVLLGEKHHDYVRMQTGDGAGDVALTSDVSAGMWTMTLVEEGAIDGAALDQKQGVGVGKTNNFHVFPTTMGERICQADLDFELTVQTPDVCDVVKLTADELQLTEAITRQKGWIKVSGKAVGDCIFQVAYAAGNAGAGAQSDVQVSIENK